MSLEVFGKLMREHREERGLDQSTAARRAGISRHTLINWERGVTQPRHRDQVLTYARDILQLGYEQVDELLWEVFEQGITEDERSNYFPSHQPLHPGFRQGFPLKIDQPLPWDWRISLWLYFLALSLSGLVGLSYLLLGAVGVLAQNVAVVVIGTFLAMLGILEISVQGRHLRTLAQSLYTWLPFRAGVVVLFLIVLVSWITVGRAVYCQTFPCDEQIILVESLNTGTSSSDEVENTTNLTTARLRRLFSLIYGFYVISEAGDFTPDQIDWRITIYYEGRNHIRLLADVMNGKGKPIIETIEVSDDVQSQEDVEVLQMELGRRLLESMGVAQAEACTALESVFATRCKSYPNSP